MAWVEERDVADAPPPGVADAFATRLENVSLRLLVVSLEGL